MQLVDLLPALHELPRTVKLRALQFLTTDLTHEEASARVPGTAYPVWSPHAATDAAAVLKEYSREAGDQRMPARFPYLPIASPCGGGRILARYE